VGDLWQIGQSLDLRPAGTFDASGAEGHLNALRMLALSLLEGVGGCLALYMLTRLGVRGLMYWEESPGTPAGQPAHRWNDRINKGFRICAFVVVGAYCAWAADFALTAMARKALAPVSLVVVLAPYPCAAMFLVSTRAAIGRFRRAVEAGRGSGAAVSLRHPVISLLCWSTLLLAAALLLLVPLNPAGRLGGGWYRGVWAGSLAAWRDAVMTLCRLGMQVLPAAWLALVAMDLDRTAGHLESCQQTAGMKEEGERRKEEG
jgi:hypothetical protein